MGAGRWDGADRISQDHHAGCLWGLRAVGANTVHTVLFFSSFLGVLTPHARPPRPPPPCGHRQHEWRMYRQVAMRERWFNALPRGAPAVDYDSSQVLGTSPTGTGSQEFTATPCSERCGFPSWVPHTCMPSTVQESQRRNEPIPGFVYESKSYLPPGYVCLPLPAQGNMHAPTDIRASMHSSACIHRGGTNPD